MLSITNFCSFLITTILFLIYSFNFITFFFKKNIKISIQQIQDKIYYKIVEAEKDFFKKTCESAAPVARTLTFFENDQKPFKSDWWMNKKNSWYTEMFKVKKAIQIIFQIINIYTITPRHANFQNHVRPPLFSLSLFFVSFSPSRSRSKLIRKISWLTLMYTRERGCEEELFPPSITHNPPRRYKFESLIWKLLRLKKKNPYEDEEKNYFFPQLYYLVLTQILRLLMLLFHFSLFSLFISLSLPHWQDESFLFQPTVAASLQLFTQLLINNSQEGERGAAGEIKSFHLHASSTLSIYSNYSLLHAMTFTFIYIYLLLIY